MEEREASASLSFFTSTIESVIPMRKLHIGGQQPHPEWEILDAIPHPRVTHLGNAKDLSRFADATFAAVYASHVAEHFGYPEPLLQALREWRRVLAPGGMLYISVPDLDILAELFLLRESLDIHGRFHVMRMMFGGQVDEHDFHHVGLNEEFLRDFLNVAGFTDVQRVDEFGIFDDTSSFAFNGVPISCNLIATNPG
jgi:predicted SAM-dependent methyltransferase